MNISSRLLGAVFCSFLTLIPLPAMAVSTGDTTVNSEELAVNLRVSDLPPPFEPAPPFVRHFIYRGIAAIEPYLEAEGISLENISSFVNFEESELVIAMTTTLDNQEVVEKFDASLMRPDAQDIFVKGVEETLRGFSNIKIAQIQELNPLKGIGNRARGFSFRADFQGLPLQLFGETIAFRRERIAALVVVGALNHPPAEVNMRDLAVRLDRRLLAGLK